MSEANCVKNAMQSPVDFRTEGLIATISLNLPDKRNGLSPEMIDGLVAALARLDQEPDVRCVILTGVGTAFSAGGDPRRMLAPGLYQDMATDEIKHHYRHGIQRLPLALQSVEVPVIAAVNGAAVGAGCDLACYCDIRIATDNATFASSFVKLGLVPGDGGAWLLPRVIGPANAAQMMLTGETIDSAAALKMGLISAITTSENLLLEANRLAQKITANPPHSVRLTKRLIAACRDVALPAALELSAAMQAMCHKMDDHREAVMAVLEKRTPRFTGK